MMKRVKACKTILFSLSFSFASSQLSVITTWSIRILWKVNEFSREFVSRSFSLFFSRANLKRLMKKCERGAAKKRESTSAQPLHVFGGYRVCMFKVAAKYHVKKGNIKFMLRVFIRQFTWIFMTYDPVGILSYFN